MFFFGNNEAVADVYRDAAISYYTSHGHGKLDTCPDEMSLYELKSLLVVFRMMHTQAARDGAEQGVIDIITQWYDQVFAMICEVDDCLKLAILDEAHFWLNGSESNNVNKYRIMAGLSPRIR